MAERKSQNKYYPPDWDPSKGSINKYVGQHPLRDRAKKLGQGILVIRFEMPYNIWCGGCGNHIGMGVRYNAEKSKTGMYYTTPIYKFRMKCHLCDNYFEIQTDPKNHDYVILEGARRKEQRWDPKENGQIETEDKGIIKKMATDAMFKLEHGSDDVKKGQRSAATMSSLEQKRDEWRDDYLLNKLARQKFREEKKAHKSEQDVDAALLAKSSLEIPLQKETADDVKLASLIKYRAIESYDERQAMKRKEIESRPLFEKTKVPKLSSPEEKKLAIIKETLNSKKQSSPFDRSIMPGMTGVSTLSKQSLGIKKRVKSVGSNFSFRRNSSQSESSLSACSEESNDVIHIDDSAVEDSSAGVDGSSVGNHFGEGDRLDSVVSGTKSFTEKTTDATNVVGNNFRLISDEETFVDRQTDKHMDTSSTDLRLGLSSEQTSENQCSVERQTLEGKNKYKHVSNKVDGTVSKPVNDYMINDERNDVKDNIVGTRCNALQKSSLSLISSYSDSESE
ncbi:coiled-coil domain-containing protein 130 homolog isoform X1 [Dreissena polymorpha]|uniref:coiled-coil domain-containing protein 130 homolog isoform X1 n=1 Tax=Dreissena polymorpha TaxID=45954 RepID=UPI0022643BA3|nr:coiled-coil domain-containing protein 130 homolog isoform X1 [Dreissena polymorpha]